MIAVIFWLLLACPIPAIGFLAFQALTTWNTSRQTLWALALTGLSAGYTVLLVSLATLAGFGLMSVALLVTHPAGSQKVLAQVTQVLAYGSAVFACVTLLGFLLLVYSLISVTWRKVPRAAR